MIESRKFVAAAILAGLALILAGLALGAQAHFYAPDYFPDDFNLFPTWPVIDSTIEARRASSSRR